MKQYKISVQTIQNTVNTCTHILKTPTHTDTPIIIIIISKLSNDRSIGSSKTIPPHSAI